MSRPDSHVILVSTNGDCFQVSNTRKVSYAGGRHLSVPLAGFYTRVKIA